MKLLIHQSCQTAISPICFGHDFSHGLLVSFPRALHGNTKVSCKIHGPEYPGHPLSPFKIQKLTSLPYKVNVYTQCLGFYEKLTNIKCVLLDRQVCNPSYESVKLYRRPPCFCESPPDWLLNSDMIPPSMNTFIYWKIVMSHKHPGGIACQTGN